MENNLAQAEVITNKTVSVSKKRVRRLKSEDQEKNEDITTSFLKSKVHSNNADMSREEIILQPWCNTDSTSVVSEAEVIRFGVKHKVGGNQECQKVFQSITEAMSQADELQQFIDRVLTEGVDYGSIQGFTKPTLLKPGAERLCRYFGVVPAVEITNRFEDYNKGFFCYEARLELIDKAGNVQATGIGLSNSREARYRMYDPFTMQNTVLKMAKKRALVDGVLNISGLSSKYTQDIEDLPYRKKSNQGNSIHPITKQQYDALCSVIRNNHISEEQFNEILLNEYQTDTWKSLDYEQMSSLIATLQGSR